MRRFFRFMPGGHDMTFDLPAPTATPSATAAAIVEILKQYNKIDRELFDRLVEGFLTRYVPRPKTSAAA